jgi:hypothetical protein
MTEKIQLTEQRDGTLSEEGQDVVWVRTSYTEPREALDECCVCEEEIEEWDLLLCMDGGESAHLECADITRQPPAVPLDIDPSPAAPGPAWAWPDEH